jgi:hypothetical protein
MTFFEIYPLIEVFDMYTKSLLNLSNEVMHNRDIVRVKTLTQFLHAR